MILLAIDPGPEQSAWLLYEDGKVMASGIEANSKAIGIIIEHAGMWNAHVVVEMVASYGMPVGAEVFETVWWIGRFCESASCVGGNFSRVYRKDVKLHLCHTLRCVNDAAIRQALIDRFGPGKEKAIGTKKAPGPLYGIKSDMWAALAVAVTFADTHVSG